MGWFVALAILLGIGIIPIGTSIRYHSEGLTVHLIAGLVRFTVFPRPQKENKKTDSKEKKQPSKKEKPKQAKKKHTSSKGGKLTDFLPLARIALQMLNDFRRKIRVDYLQLNVILAGEDPCDLALNYSRVWTAVGNLLPRLERVLVIKKRDIEVQCDFESTDIRVLARVDCTITIGRILCLGVVYGFRFIKSYLSIMKKRKGGAAA